MNYSRILLALFSPVILAGTVLATGDLGADLKSGDLWKMETAAFQQNYLQEEYGSWLNEEKTSLRIPEPKMTVGEMKPGETIIDWKDGKVSSVQIMVYNKGDDGTLGREDFEGKVSSTKTLLDQLTGTQGKAYKPNSRESAIKNINGYQWQWPGGKATLEAGASGNTRKNFEAEFIRLRLLSPDASPSGSTERVRKLSLRDNIKKEGQRVVIENIPMVDQGQKGYCAVATAARVFGYYGKDVDQHSLAAAADTSAEGGTSTEAMVTAMTKIGSKFQMRTKKYRDNIDSIRDYQSLISNYNRQAKRMKKPPVAENNSNLATIWNVADGEVLKAMRAGKQADIDKWMAELRKDINNGVPVIWSVELGLAPEPVVLSQARGGHMRLIIGYDDEKKVILFSDSWGMQHACKEMPMADAAAITISRMTMEPRS